MIRFEAQGWLNALWALPLLLAVAWMSTRAIANLPRRLICTAVRLAFVSALVVALSRPVHQSDASAEHRSDVIVLRDVSRSTENALDDSIRIERELRSAMSPDCRPRTALFAKSTAWPADANAIERSETRIADAIDWAATQFEGDVDGHVVLLSDGRSTRGDPVAAAARARHQGLRIHVVSIGHRQIAPPRIVGVIPPDMARVAQAACIQLQVRTDTPTDMRVALETTEGFVLGELSTRVNGDSVVAIPFVPQRKGFSNVRLSIGSDGRVQDAADIGFDVAGPPSVLVCDPEPSALSGLLRAMEDLNLEFTSVTPEEFPKDARALEGFDAVVISDVPRPILGASASLLEAFIRKGGGLVFLGGARVSTRDWRGSPLEALLPVDFAPERVRGRVQLRPVHVCYVLDVSGSMTEPLGADSAGPVSKFAMMKTAVLRSLDVLPENAEVTLIVFDATHRVVAEAVPVTERDRIARAVETLYVGGGTNMVPGMGAGITSLLRSDAARHMILLTDGVSSENPTREMCDLIRDAKISLTTIAVGADSNVDMLKWLARTTQGIFYACTDANAIPRVFVNEAEVIKTLASLDRNPVQPQPGPQAGWLAEVASADWPLLATALPFRAKPSSAVEIPLVGDHGEPLLAAWRFGVGRVVAFASDAKPIWARRWIEWAEFERFWGRVLSQAIPASTPLLTRTDVSLEGDSITILVSVLDQDGRPCTDLIPEASTDTDGFDDGGVPAQWRRLASGVFEGRAVLSPEHRNFCRLVVRAANGAALARRDFAFSEASAETRETGPDESRLQAIAQAGGGVFNVQPETLRDLTGRNRATLHAVRTALWPWLVAVALVLWPIDLALRRAVQ